jgi:hypothetical protein
MNRSIILAAVLIAFGASLVFGQAGGIGLYAAADYVGCEILDTAPGVYTVYVVHKFTAGARAAQFKIAPGGGFNLVYTGETSPFTTVGDSQTGICIEYGACLASDILLLTVNYFGTGTSPACSWLAVVPHPNVSEIEILDCAGRVYAGYGNVLHVNTDSSCPCSCLRTPAPDSESMLLDPGPAESLFYCATSPIERGSWGQIKALYN